MNALSEVADSAADRFVVAYGKSGGVGVFTADQPLHLRRGDCVVIDSPRGIEAGTVLCPASDNQARLLGAVTPGGLLRALTGADATQIGRHRLLADSLFTAARTLVVEVGVAMEIVDVEVLLEGRQAIVQHLGNDERAGDVIAALERRFDLEIRLENVAQASAPFEEVPTAGCDKPDCGRAAGGTCSTCSTDGGCSSCGSPVDLRQYFSHLRNEMDQRQRRSLA